MNIRKESKIDPALAEGREVPAAATTRTKNRYSGFFITYVNNTQYEYRGEAAKNFALELKGVVDDMIDDLASYVIFNKGSLADVQDVETKTVIEQGKLTGHVHAHMILQFKHQANIRMDFAKMKAYLNEACGIIGHFDFNLLRKEEQAHNYLEKTLRSIHTE